MVEGEVDEIGEGRKNEKGRKAGGEGIRSRGGS